MQEGTEWLVHDSASALLSTDQTSHVILFQVLGITFGQRSGPYKEQIVIKNFDPQEGMRREKKEGSYSLL